jgi:hypothetical protein
VKRSALAITTTALLAVLLQPASAAPTRTVELTAASPQSSWTGARATGVATSPFLPKLLAQPCGEDPLQHCEQTLVRVDVPRTDPTTALTVRVQDFGRAVDDFDLYVFESDGAGRRGRLAGRSTSDAAVETATIVDVDPGDHYLVEVLYRTVVASDHRGVVTLSGLPPQPTS